MQVGDPVSFPGGTGYIMQHNGDEVFVKHPDGRMWSVPLERIKPIKRIEYPGIAEELLKPKYSRKECERICTVLGSLLQGATSEQRRAIQLLYNAVSYARNMK